jgi:hypothetical protein
MPQSMKQDAALMFNCRRPFGFFSIVYGGHRVSLAGERFSQRDETKNRLAASRDDDDDVDSDGF